MKFLHKNTSSKIRDNPIFESISKQNNNKFLKYTPLFSWMGFNVCINNKLLNENHWKSVNKKNGQFIFWRLDKRVVHIPSNFVSAMLRLYRERFAIHWIHTMELWVEVHFVLVHRRLALIHAKWVKSFRQTHINLIRSVKLLFTNRKASFFFQLCIQDNFFFSLIALGR